MPLLPRSQWPLLLMAALQGGMASTFITAPLRDGEWAPTWPHVLFLLLGLALLVFAIRNVRRLRPALKSLREQRAQ
ncbi:hypothetical protein ASG90_18300 [Nocardioides sp. Soil797]|nr:hypothetical protein ASG90_18300 [Nocardioides sp. Soil797]